jgi:hypothetical protein
MEIIISERIDRGREIKEGETENGFIGPQKTDG